jgi:hypothetical protein
MRVTVLEAKNIYLFHDSGKQKNHEISDHDVPENERQELFSRNVKSEEHAGK